MEFAIGVVFQGVQLNVYALNESGRTEIFPLKDLYKRGIPNVSKPVRRRIDSNLNCWHETSGNAYLEAFGLAVTANRECSHKFFEVNSGRRTFIVPALALMRAIFRPTKHLLPEMFLPHALDRQCRLQQTPSGVSVLVDAAWTATRQSQKCSDWCPLFDWVVGHPSANKMAGSVHAHAMASQIGFQLPSAEMRLVLRGLESDSTIFVTDVSIMTITPLDEPSFALRGSKSNVTVINRKVRVDMNETFGAKFTVPCLKNGFVEITDDEWTHIEPEILKVRERRRVFELPQRELLNGVLIKLATDTPWKKVSYKVGNWSNAYTAFRKWASDGTLNSILAILSTTRLNSNTRATAFLPNL